MPSVDWSKYGWNWQDEGLRKLLNFALLVDAEALRHRILTRIDNDSGKDPVELKNTLDGHVELPRELLAVPQAVGIDADDPLDIVVDHILNAAT